MANLSPEHLVGRRKNPWRSDVWACRYVILIYIYIIHMYICISGTVCIVMLLLFPAAEWK